MKEKSQNFFSIKNNDSHKVINVLGIKVKFKRKYKNNNSNLKNANKDVYQSLHYVIAMLKEFNIKYVVASPGSQNAFFNLFVQKDKSFQTYSVIDERSAAYVASGIASESGEPVVITCTGATASRNYLSAMTECYYNKLPVIALTFQPYAHNRFNIMPQYVDRTISQNDVKAISVNLPKINNSTDKEVCIAYLNAALTEAVYNKMPVHINCPSCHNWANLENTNLPKDIWKTEFYFDNFVHVKEELVNKKIGVFIGSHKNFSQKEETMLSKFASSWNAPVFCDHTSNYNGENKVLISQVAFMRDVIETPDIIIDLGGICGDYSSNRILDNAKIWRVDFSRNFKQRGQRPVHKIFACEEVVFFKTLVNDRKSKNNYFEVINSEVAQNKIPELPLSMYFVSQQLSNNIPKNSSLHLAILSSLRSMDCYNLDKSIDVTSNVGGFGIDGAISTAVGQSLVNPNKKVFCLIGDLAFFYDINALGIRHIQKNLRILVVNNGRGSEFSMGGLYYPIRGKNDNLVAAAGHYKGNPVKGFSEGLGYKYLCASTKEEFLSKIKDFCNKDFNKPVLFEVFTTDEKEIKAFDLMYEFNRNI